MFCILNNNGISSVICQKEQIKEREFFVFDDGLCTSRVEYNNDALPLMGTTIGCNTSFHYSCKRESSIGISKRKSTAASPDRAFWWCLAVLLKTVEANPTMS